MVVTGTHQCQCHDTTTLYPLHCKVRCCCWSCRLDLAAQFCCLMESCLHLQQGLFMGCQNSVCRVQQALLLVLQGTAALLAAQLPLLLFATQPAAAAAAAWSAKFAAAAEACMLSRQAPGDGHHQLRCTPRDACSSSSSSSSASASQLQQVSGRQITSDSAPELCNRRQACPASWMFGRCQQ